MGSLQAFVHTHVHVCIHMCAHHVKSNVLHVQCYICTCTLIIMLLPDIGVQAKSLSFGGPGSYLSLRVHIPYNFLTYHGNQCMCDITTPTCTILHPVPWRVAWATVCLPTTVHVLYMARIYEYTV